MKKLTIVIGIILVAALSLTAGCGNSEPIVTPTAFPTATPWQPDQIHLLTVPRDQLRMGGDDYILIAPADYITIPVSVEQGEVLQSWGWSVEGTTEDYIDSWMVNNSGEKIVESGRHFNFGCQVNISTPGTYYIYLSNEFTSAIDKKVYLFVHWK